MGIGLLFCSWLVFCLPVEQQGLALTMQKKIMAENTLTGVASFYHPRFVGRPTATGEIFSNNRFTAASNHFKLGTYVKITNLKNGRTIYVKINDRMGQPNRVIDLTHRAAESLHFVHAGLTKVTIKPVPAPIGRQRVLAQLEEGDTVLPDNAI